MFGGYSHLQILQIVVNLETNESLNKKQPEADRVCRILFGTYSIIKELNYFLLAYFTNVVHLMFALDLVSLV